MKYSIVIPTYNHCDDLLKPCIESVIKHTDLSTAEIIVIANGCTDNTKQYLESLNNQVRYYFFDEPLGYTKAVNIGIKKSTGDYIVLLNNDTILLDWQNKNGWLTLLEQPFLDNPNMALTGPLKLFDHDIKQHFLVFCLVMIKHDMFYKLGLLDEIFSPGYGEDIDFCMKAKQNNYEFFEICREKNEQGNSISRFPFYHKSTQTFKDIPEYANNVVPRNIKTLKERYL